ncbi:hypothetical protein BGZ76_003581 [Entomortierella beljakovae]|nr:hypothetical protein BGZ76_003581 [Entomortierella beljakovae]
MTVPESNKPVITVNIIPTATSTKVHQFVRQIPTTSTASDEICHNCRVSIQPTGFEGGLLVGLYDPHIGPQCAEYLQQHLIPILDESLSTQLDHSDDDTQSTGPNSCNIDPTQVVDTLKSTFRELDELLLATAITVALAQPETTDETGQEEIVKTQELLSQVVTGSTAMVGFLASHASTPEGDNGSSTVQKHDFYLAQLGDSVAILAGLNEKDEWTAQRLNPPEIYEHSVRYPGSEEYRKVTSEAKQRALTAEEFLTQHDQQPSLDENGVIDPSSESFLTRHGEFLGLPVTRAFGDLDWKLEQDARFSVSTWVEKSLRSKIDKKLRSGREGEDTGPNSQEDINIANLSDPPYVSSDPKILRFALETRKSTSDARTGPSDQFLILMSRGLLHSSHARSSNNNANPEPANVYDQALISDFDLSRLVANALDKGEENCAMAVSKALDQSRKDQGATESGEAEGSVVVIVF